MYNSRKNTYKVSKTSKQAKCLPSYGKKSKRHVNKINKREMNEEKRVREGWKMERKKAEDK